MAAAVCLVVGQGYVGLPVAMRAVEAGFDVVGFDADAAKVKRLNAGDSYVEDVADEVVPDALATGRYRAVTTLDDIDGFDVAVISVPTPLREGAPDLGHIESAASDRRRSPAHAVRPVILESTTYPGHDRGARRADPRGSFRARRRTRLPPRLQPRAHRPRQPDVDVRRTRRRSCPASTRRRSAPCAGSTTSSSSRRCRSRRRRKPSSPSCSRTRSVT